MDDAKNDTNEMTFSGIPASPGIAFGEAFVVNVEDLPVEEEHISRRPRSTPRSRGSMSALARTEKELQKLVRSLEEEIGEEHGKILDSHRMILKDEFVRSETIKVIKEQKVNAAYALSLVLDRGADDVLQHQGRISQGARRGYPRRAQAHHPESHGAEGSKG